ncbi:hypothetical protein QZH41_008331 [Actinostola sp. cb2023]|nr:hypothetical protein QZH41_008331 [Actinostola sp. cb2023]
MVRILVALVLVAVSIVVIGGSPPYKEKGPPRQVDEDVPENKISVRDQRVVGDMILPRDRFRKTSKNTRAKRMAYSNEYKWPKSGDTVTIPYTEASGIDSDVLNRAIAVFNAKTCIRFVPRGSQSNYVSFQYHDSRCNAQTGYLDIGNAANFDIQDSYVDQGIAYDCDSILHYKATAFATPSSVTTISSPNGYCTAFGNDDTRLSLKDYKRVNTLYGCDPNPNYRFFTVRVVTSGSFAAGTDCFIYMKLHGSQRTSSEFELDLDNAGSSNLFERNSDDTFSKMAFRDDLGTITGISIRVVLHGSFTGWKPTKFIVTDPVHNNNEHTFTNSQWLYPSSTYGTDSFTTV